MDHYRLCNALEKVEGVTIESDPCKVNRWIAKKGDRLVTWWSQDDDTCLGAKVSAHCLRVPSPMTDASTDCFCDSYLKTIKAAKAYLEGTHL